MEWSIIVAIDRNNGIGVSGKMPWNLPADLKYFQEVTTKVTDPSKKNIVVMGRKTWESLPLQKQPLTKRINIILSRNKNYHISDKHDTSVCYSWEELKEKLDSDKFIRSYEKIFIVGGYQIYLQALEQKKIQNLYVTHIQNTYQVDVTFPSFENLYPQKKILQNWQTEKNIQYQFCYYTKKLDNNE